MPASTDSRSVSDRLKALEPDRLEGVTAPSAQRRLVVGVLGSNPRNF